MITDEDARRNAMIEKVKALWAKADDPACTPEEAEVFRSKAAEMMAKYEIDQFILDSGDGKGEPPIVFGQFRIDDLKSFLVPDERMMLAGAIARNFECKGVIKNVAFDTADPKTGEPIAAGVFFECIGYKHDFDMVKSLFFNLVTDMLVGLLSEQQKDKNYQREFASGFVDRIDRRLQEMYRRVNDWVDNGEVSESVALAIRSRLQKVQDKFNEMYPPDSLGKVQYRSPRYDPNARARGRDRANNADLGGGKLTGSSTSAGSLGQGNRALNK